MWKSIHLVNRQTTERIENRVAFIVWNLTTHDGIRHKSSDKMRPNLIICKAQWLAWPEPFNWKKRRNQAYFATHITAIQKYTAFWPLIAVASFVAGNTCMLWKLKAELNPKAATLDWYAYLVPLLVLNNIPKCKKPQSNHFLTTSTYIQTDGIADP